MGIEAVPSFQALGHLEQYVRYNEAKEFTENCRVLRCGEEKTYEFIETIVKSIHNCLKYFTHLLCVVTEESKESW